MTEQQTARIIELLEIIADSLGKKAPSDPDLLESAREAKAHLERSEIHLSRLETMLGELPWPGATYD